MKKLIANFKALGSGNRLLILLKLKQKQKTVNELAVFLGVSLPTASYHLNKLFREGYVGRERKGNQTYYFLPDKVSRSGVYRQIERFK